MKGLKITAVKKPWIRNGSELPIIYKLANATH